MRFLVYMYYTNPGYRTSIFGKNCAYYIPIFTLIITDQTSGQWQQQQSWSLMFHFDVPQLTFLAATPHCWFSLNCCLMVLTAHEIYLCLHTMQKEIRRTLWIFAYREHHQVYNLVIIKFINAFVSD